MAARINRSSMLGFSMLEVLVAILVTSFGLLSLAGLQLVGIRMNQTAHLRATAVQQAQDIAERIRANLPGYGAGSYDNLNGSTPTLATDCGTASCVPADMATYDHRQWNSANAIVLPGGFGIVNRNTAVGGDPDELIVRVMWTEKEMNGASDSAANCTSALVAANRRCFVFGFRP